MKLSEMNLIMLGPTAGEGGIATVINTILKTSVFKFEKVFRVATSVYKDGGTWEELLIFGKGFMRYIYLLLFQRIDIVHIHSSYYVSFIRKTIFAFTGFAFRKKIIFHIHSSDFDSFFILQNNPLFRFLIRLILKRSAANIVLCHEWKKKLENAYDLENVVSIRNPNPFKISRKKAKLDGRTKFCFLFMGFYIPSKGVLDLLQAAFMLAKQGVDNFSMMLCGKGELNDEINAAIKAYRLDNVVINKGWVAGAERERCFEIADVLVLPSYKEGMPMVILEALSFGLPVISTRVAGIPEIIKDGRNGFLVTPGDVRALAILMKEMINNNELRTKIAEENCRHAEYFAPEKIAAEWRALYNSCLDSGS